MNFKEWRTTHPKQWKRIWIGLIVAAVLLGTGLFWGVKFAKAAPATLDCGVGITPVWTQSTLTLGCPGTPTPPIDPTPIPPVACPSGSIVITGRWGDGLIYTSGFRDQMMAIELAPPVGWTGGATNSSWVEYIDGGTMRYYAISKKACSFSDADVLRFPSGAYVRGTSNPGFTLKYRSGASSASYIGLTPGVVYWVNVLNRYADGSKSCTGASNCDMRGEIKK
jgi:hypothetical protein